MSLIEVRNEETGGTARVPEKALKHMKGWEKAEGSPPAQNVLKGAALDAALKEAGLPTSGTADQKRARLAEHHDSKES